MANTIATLANSTATRKTRLKNLVHTLAALEARAARTAPIPVITTRCCPHPECGSTRPRTELSDALIIKLGCLHELPRSTTAADR